MSAVAATVFRAHDPRFEDVLGDDARLELVAEVDAHEGPVYVDDEVMRAARIRAARAGKRDSDIVEEALRAYLGFDAIEAVWGRSALTEDEALSLANDEVHAARVEGRRASG